MVFAPQLRHVSIPLDSLPVATAVTDAKGTILDANDRFRRLFGIARTTDAPPTLADLVAEPHRPAVQQAIDDLSTADRDGFADRPAPPCRLRATRAKTPNLWLTIELTRLEPESGCAYLVCAQPIVKRRRVDGVPQNPIKRTQAAMQRAVTVPAGATAIHNEPWPPLLTLLSHELRGSLNAIRGWVAIAEGGSLPSDRLPRAFSIIKRNAESLSGLVENLFDLSRHAAGSLALKRELLDLNQLVELVVESTYPAATCRDVRLTVGCARGPLLVNGDRVRLEQVVRNLVDNAIKFTPGGGTVRLRTICHRPFCELVVDDTGAGIAPDLLPAIFDPFRRGVADVRAADVGVGLGLALVRELVQMHQGQVQAISRGRGHGSTFIVTLPLAPVQRPFGRKPGLAGRRSIIRAA